MYFDHAYSFFTQSHLLDKFFFFFLLMISERKFHHGGPGIANGVAVSAAIMVGQAGKGGGRVHSLLC